MTISTLDSRVGVVTGAAGYSQRIEQPTLLPAMRLTVGPGSGAEARSLTPDPPPEGQR